MKLHYGVDLYAVALQQALGLPPDTALAAGPAAAILIIRAPRTGRLLRQRVPESMRSLPGVQRISFDYPEAPWCAPSVPARIVLATCS